MVKWNYSLDNVVRKCQRQAFLRNRFACPTATKGSLRHEAFLMKQALDLSAWKGRLVHAAIDQWVIQELKQKRWPNFDHVKNQALDLVTKQREFSQQALYRQFSKKAAAGKYCVLRADYYSMQLTHDKIEEVKDGVASALDVLQHNHRSLLERMLKARRLENEKEIRFNLDNVILIEATPDLIIFEPGGRWVIVDWKVWENPHGSARDQLHAYAFAALQCGWWPELRIDGLELIEANLITGEAKPHRFTEDDFDMVDDRIFTGSELLRPIFESDTNSCGPDDFASAESPNVCQWCPVKEVCSGKPSSKQPKVQSVLFELF
jgi:hypothetical protein